MWVKEDGDGKGGAEGERRGKRGVEEKVEGRKGEISRIQ